MKNYTCGCLIAVALSACFGLYPSAAVAREMLSGDTPLLSDAVAQADAVVHGVVNAVSYRLSGTEDDSERVPHVFVDYTIVQSLKGRVANESITLRFVGGPDGRGGYLVDSSVPVFNVGDEDVLLIRRNGEVACPLVGCLAGRFRIHQDRVYSGNASPLVGLADDRTHYGRQLEPALLKVEFPSPTFDELLRNPRALEQMHQAWPQADQAEMRRLYDAQRQPTHVIEYGFSPDEDSQSVGMSVGDGLEIEVVPASDPGSQQALPTAELVQTLSRISGSLGETKPVTIANLDRDAPFWVPTAEIDAAPPADMQ